MSRDRPELSFIIVPPGGLGGICSGEFCRFCAIPTLRAEDSRFPIRSIVIDDFSEGMKPDSVVVEGVPTRNWIALEMPDELPDDVDSPGLHVAAIAAKRVHCVDSAPFTHCSIFQNSTAGDSIGVLRIH